MNQRDLSSIKCTDCGYHIMMLNTIKWNKVDGEYRPVYNNEELVDLEATCVSCFHRVKLKGTLRILEMVQIEED